MATQPQKLTVSDFYVRYGDNNDELIDGVFKERGLTGLTHNELMSRIWQWFQQHSREWNIGTSITYDFILDEHNKLVPDVTVFDAQNRREEYLTHTPIAVFEVASARDEKHPGDVLYKLAKYEARGVPEIWQASRSGEFKRYHQGVLTTAGSFEYKHIRFDFAAIVALMEE